MTINKDINILCSNRISPRLKFQIITFAGTNNTPSPTRYKLLTITVVRSNLSPLLDWSEKYIKSPIRTLVEITDINKERNLMILACFQTRNE